MKPAISAPGSGRQIRVGPNVITYRTTAVESEGRVGVIDYVVGPGFVAPPVLHWHTRESWTGYLLEGTLRFRFAGGVSDVEAGSVIHVPVHCPFAWENATDQAARSLFVYTPGGFEAYFTEIAELFARNPGKTIKDLMSQVLATSEKYGIERETTG